MKMLQDSGFSYGSWIQGKLARGARQWLGSLLWASPSVQVLGLEDCYKQVHESLYTPKENTVTGVSWASLPQDLKEVFHSPSSELWPPELCK